MNRVVLLLLIVVLLFQESDAIFGKKRKEREEAERTAAFMERALAASAKMTAARDKDQRKIERTRAALGTGTLEAAIAEHASEALSPEAAALVTPAHQAPEVQEF